MKKTFAIITLSALSACLWAIETPPPIEPPETFNVPGLAFDEEPQSSPPNPTAKHFFDGKSFKRDVFSVDATGVDCSAVMLVNNAKFEVGKIRVLKLGEITSKPAGNTIGLNAALSVGSGSKMLVDSGEIRTNAVGANAVSVWGGDSQAMVKNLAIKTESNLSRALFADDGGLLEAEDVIIETRGENSAALEAIGGTVSVANVTAKTMGQSSPVICSAGRVAIVKSILSSFGAEAVLIEGPSTVEINDSDLFARKNCGVLICQRIAGGPQNGAAVFSMSGGTLASEAKSIFCVTNAACTINLDNVNIRFRSSSDIVAPQGEMDSPIDNNDFSKIVLVNARQEDLGTPDNNGGHVILNAVNQNLPGVIFADQVSSVELNLKSSKFAGTVNGNVIVTLDENSSWTLTDDANLSAIRGSINNVVTNGHQIFYTAPQPQPQSQAQP